MVMSTQSRACAAAERGRPQHRARGRRRWAAGAGRGPAAAGAGGAVHWDSALANSCIWSRTMQPCVGVRTVQAKATQGWRRAARSSAGARAWRSIAGGIAQKRGTLKVPGAPVGGRGCVCMCRDMRAQAAVLAYSRLGAGRAHHSGAGGRAGRARGTSRPLPAPRGDCQKRRVVVCPRARGAGGGTN